MLLNNCELVPAVITNTDDELKLGRIKCVIPGYVDSTFSDYNKPWVRPFCMNKHQQFSKMMPGYKVWVLVNKSNYNEYWYLPFFEMNDVTKEYLDDVYDDEQPEVIMAHNNGGLHPLLTYDEKNGFSERIGEDHIDLHPDGHISIVGKKGEVDIKGNKIKVGKQGDTYEPAVKGDQLKSLFQAIMSACDVGAGGPYAAPAAFEAIKGAIQTYLSALFSTNVSIN